MYKKIKLNKEEKKILPTIIVFVLIQILIICFLKYMFKGIKPVDIKDTKQIDITVDRVYMRKTLSRHNGVLVVASNSAEYIFHNNKIFEEYPVRKLKSIISKGDRLSLVYLEKSRGDLVVLEAKTETVTYRSFEDYNRTTKGGPIILIITFSIFESIFLGALTLYFLGWSHHFKSIRKKMKKNAERRKKYKESLKSNN